MTLIPRLFISFIALSVLVFPTLSALAQNTSGPGNTSGEGNTSGPGNTSGTGTCGGDGALVNPLQVCSLEELFGKILDAIITIGTMVLVLMIVFVGFKFVVARGNPEEISAARSALMWTVIGGLILLGAKAIQMVITETVQSL